MGKMSLQYANRCKICESELPVGTMAYGERTGRVLAGGLRRFEFTCMKCIATGSPGVPGAPSSVSITMKFGDDEPAPPASHPVPDDIVAMFSADTKEGKDAFAELLNGIASERVESSQVVVEVKPFEPPAYSKEWISRNAVWGKI